MQDFTWNKCWVIDHDKKEVLKASVCTWLEMSRADDISNIIWCHWRPNKKLHEWTRIYFVSRSNTLAVKCFNSGMRSLIIYVFCTTWYMVFSSYCHRKDDCLHYIYLYYIVQSKMWMLWSLEERSLKILKNHEFFERRTHS